MALIGCTFVYIDCYQIVLVSMVVAETLYNIIFITPLSLGYPFKII